ncbi:MAG: LysM peptidoglycan-binding domain-containing protein [Chloroflexi bacterium]|nr:LysM peptidoglycan-binding domain-containing protein [Chloroflexota bacterium]
MKRLTQIRYWLPALLLLSLVLVACERPLNSDEDTATAYPVLPDTSVVPTNDPNVQPTVDPATVATTVPAETTDPVAGEATAVPEATTAPDPSTPRGEVNHTVVSGDTISGLSLLYDISVEAIVAANDIPNVDSLEVGQVLIIPAEGTVVEATAVPVEPTAVPPVTEERTHIVRAGENLFRIGIQYGFSYQELASYNNIPNPHDLDVGQVIKIPPSN